MQNDGRQFLVRLFAIEGKRHLILKGNIWVLLAKPGNALLYYCVRTTQIDLICFGLQVRFLPRKGVLWTLAFIMTPFGAIQQTLLDLGWKGLLLWLSVEPS